MSGDKDHLSHVDGRGRARMVDVSSKSPTERTAVASGRIRLAEPVSEAIAGGTAAKGDVLSAARIAGIQAVKRTADLIPLCHPLSISHAGIELELKAGSLVARCTVSGIERTGFEMEALTGVTVALLTVYDMVKSLDRSMEINDIHLQSKSGGSGGDYQWQG